MSKHILRYSKLALLATVPLLSSCGDSESGEEAKSEAPLKSESAPHVSKPTSPKEKLEAMKMFKFHFNDLHGVAREPEEVDLEIAEEVRKSLVEKDGVLFKTDAGTWMIQFDERTKLSGGRRLEYRGLSDIDFVEAPYVIIQIIKAPSTEADRLNGVEWRGSVIFQTHTRRRYEYAWKEKKFEASPWRTNTNYSIIFYKWKAAVVKGNVLLKGGQLGDDLMKVDPVKARQAMKDNTDRE